MPALIPDPFAALAALPEEQIDLAEAALLIADEADPPPDPAACLCRLDELAASAEEHLAFHGSPRARVEALCHFVFGRERFHGNTADYYDVRNSYLHEVLRRRTGIPITLALLLIELGKRVHLPLEGVNFPGHFLVRHVSPRGDVLVDPFSGRLLDGTDCEALLQRVAGPQASLRPELFHTAAPKALLRRMLNNLKGIHLRQEAWGDALRCSERTVLLAPDDPDELGDRGLLYHRLECFSEAVRDLERALALAPDGLRTDALRNTLEDARERVLRLS